MSDNRRDRGPADRARVNETHEFRPIETTSVPFFLAVITEKIYDFLLSA